MLGFVGPMLLGLMYATSAWPNLTRCCEKISWVWPKIRFSSGLHWSECSRSDTSSWNKMKSENKIVYSPNHSNIRRTGCQLTNSYSHIFFFNTSNDCGIILFHSVIMVSQICHPSNPLGSLKNVINWLKTSFRKFTTNNTIDMEPNSFAFFDNFFRRWFTLWDVIAREKHIPLSHIKPPPMKSWL